MLVVKYLILFTRVKRMRIVGIVVRTVMEVVAGLVVVLLCVFVSVIKLCVPKVNVDIFYLRCMIQNFTFTS